MLCVECLPRMGYDNTTGRRRAEPTTQDRQDKLRHRMTSLRDAAARPARAVPEAARKIGKANQGSAHAGPEKPARGRAAPACADCVLRLHRGVKQNCCARSQGLRGHCPEAQGANRPQALLVVGADCGTRHNRRCRNVRNLGRPAPRRAGRKARVLAQNERERTLLPDTRSLAKARLGPKPMPPPSVKGASGHRGRRSNLPQDGPEILNVQ